MDKLVDLFQVIELTRSQVQYRYILGGVKRGELSNLAEHHYLVTFIAWQLALFVNAKGAKIDVLKVLEFSLIHDLGELLGGDISMPYAAANPKAREFAKAFEAENQKYLSKIFGSEQKHYQQLSDEIMDAKTDESIISKLADYIEITHYKKYVENFSSADTEMILPKLLSKIQKMNDTVAKAELEKFVIEWVKDLPRKGLDESLYENGKSYGA